MAATLKATIELQGAQAILKQLEGLGKAGEKAFVDIKNSADKVGGFQNLKTEEVQQKLRNVGLEGEQAFNKIRGAVETAVRVERILGALSALQNGFAGVANAALSFVRALGPLGLAVGAVAAVSAGAAAAIVKLAESHAKAALAIDTTAQKLGLTVQQYERLRAAANNAGISTEVLNSGLQKLKGQVDAAATAQFKAYADEVVRLSAAGQTSAAALNVLNAAAAGTGEKAKIAQEAIKQIGLAAASTAKQITTATTPLRNVADLLDQTARKLQAMPDSTARTEAAINALGDALGTRLIQALRSGPAAVARLIEEIKTSTGGLTQDQINNAARIESAWTRVQEKADEIRRSPPPQFVSDASIAILNAAHDTLVRINTFLQDPSWANFGNVFVPVWELIKQGASIAFEFVKTKAGEMFSAIAEAVLTPIEGAWQWITATFAAIMARIVQIATETAAALRRVLTQSPDRSGTSVTGEPTGDGLARGGLIRGRGTGTSDSNLAWLSRGEFVNRQKSVDYYGAPLFHALNQMRIPRERLLAAIRGARGFNLGGLVDGLSRSFDVRAIPGLASGGMNPGGAEALHHVTINFAGQIVEGLRAPSSVVEELRKAAVLGQTRSAGPKPSRY